MAKEVARVARRIDDAKETHYLDLSKCELNQIPEATYMMLKNTTLERCNLSSNTVKRIPSKFCTKFPSLTELQLQDNALTSIPDDFKNLEELRILDISSNKFETFPSFIYECSKLTNLLARDNKITEVDVERLRKMDSLREVDLQDNPLTGDTESRLSDIDVFTVLVGESDPIGRQLEDVE